MEGPIISFLYNNLEIFSTLGILIIFVVSFLESTPFFGLIMPAQTMLIVGGFLTNITEASFYPIVISAVVGSVAGDIASFYAGRKFGPGILTKYGSKFFIKKEYVAKTQQLLDEHLGKTLFIGRLSSLSRSLGPFLAGSSKINFLRFLSWVTAGAILWSSVIIGIGFVFAESFDIIGPAVGKFIFSALVILFILLGTLIYLRKRHFFITSRHIILIIISVLTLFTFSLIGQSVIENTGIKDADAIFYPQMENIRSDGFTSIALFFTHLGDEVALSLLTLCIAGLLYVKRNRLHAFLLCFSVFVGAISVYIIKISVGSARPLFGIIEETSKSFPSGHATLSTVFALTLGYIMIKKEDSENRLWVIALLAMIFPLMIGFSRLYLGVHWLSDVLGGFMLGIFVTTISILIFDFLPWLYRKIMTRQIAPNL